MLWSFPLLQFGAAGAEVALFRVWTNVALGHAVNIVVISATSVLISHPWKCFFFFKKKHVVDHVVLRDVV